jgi:hypothetical protein
MEGGFSGRVGGWRRRIEEAGSRPPKMVLWVNAGAAMCATPVFIVEGFRYRRRLATTDTAFDQQRAPELVGARRLFRSSSRRAGRPRLRPEPRDRISWFQTGHCSGRHCHDTGSFGEPQPAASASRCAGRDLHDTTSGASDHKRYVCPVQVGVGVARAALRFGEFDRGLAAMWGVRASRRSSSSRSGLWRRLVRR